MRRRGSGGPIDTQRNQRAPATIAPAGPPFRGAGTVGSVSDVDEAAQVAHRWIERYNDGTPDSYGSDAFLELYTDDCVWWEMPTTFFPSGRSGGIAELRAAVHDAHQLGLRDRRAVLHDVVADGTTAAMRFTWSATIPADSPRASGGQPVVDGTRLTMDIAAFFEVRHGRIMEIREFVSAPHP